MSHIILGNRVYRRVEALRDPEPNQQAMMELATLLGFRTSDRVSPPAIIKRLQGVVEEVRSDFKANVSRLSKIHKVLRKELSQKPARASMILSEHYTGDTASQALSNYEHPGNMEDWAEFPATLGMAYVDMSNELPSALGGIGKTFDTTAETLEYFDEIADLVTSVNPGMGAKLERVSASMKDSVQKAFFGG